MMQLKKIWPVLVAVLYLAMPRDLVPDFMIGWGWLDDVIVVYLLWRLLKNRMQTGTARSRNEDRQQSSANNQTGYRRPPTSQLDPHAVLGVTHNASPETIKIAYKNLAAKYHPDKVQHLGEEFQALAEKRFKEIQQAYQTLRGSYGKH